MTDKEPLKITLEDLGLSEPPAPAPPPVEPPAQPDRPVGKAREAAEQVGQRMAGAVKDSTAKVTHKIADATADAVEERLRQVDWKAEATKGAEGGLRWLSKRLEALAERMRADEKKQ